MVNGAEPASLDPHAVEGVPEHRIYLALFEGLTINDPRTNRALPAVAESWSFSKDYKTCTFKIRKGVTWSDGVEITADTVVQSWIRKMDPKNAFQYADLPAMYIEGGMDYLNGKAGPEALKIRAVDKYTFEVNLVGPIPFFADMVSHYAFAIVPMHVIEKYGTDWVKPGKMVSNGPFVLSEWKPQEKDRRCQKQISIGMQRTSHSRKSPLLQAMISMLATISTRAAQLIGRKQSRLSSWMK